MEFSELKELEFLTQTPDEIFAEMKANAPYILKDIREKKEILPQTEEKLREFYHNFAANFEQKHAA